MVSQRQRRVNEQLRHIISETMRRGHFTSEVLFETAGAISVTEVRTSPDLKNATAYVMSLGGDNMDEILPALNSAAHAFQKDIGHNLNMKFTPRIKFVTDDSFDEAQKIENILKNLPHQKTDKA